MASPNTIKMRESGPKPTPILIKVGQPNFTKRFIRDQKGSRARTTRGHLKMRG